MLFKLKIIPLPLLMISCLWAFTPGSGYRPSLNEDEINRIEAGEIIMREAQVQNPKGQAYELVGMVDAPGKLLYEILIDYVAYPQFMSAVGKVEVLGTPGEETTLNYTLKPLLGFTKRYRINISSAEVEPGVWKVAWYLVEWPGLSPMETIKDTQGYWIIIEESPGRSLLQYYVYSDPGYVPFLLRSAVKALSKSSVKEVFEETRDWAEH